VIRPPSLRPGSRVSLVAAAGPLPAGALDRAVKRVRELGWEPLVGPHAAGRVGFLAGTDSERLHDLQEALRSAENDAIWCLRGGYGTMRLLPRIDWSPLRERPRALIGFSDNTALHLAAGQAAGVVTFHGPHPAPPELPAFARENLFRVVAHTRAAGVLPFPQGGPPRAASLVPGVAEGRLVGGNLAILAATAGTPYQLRARGRILFLEEVGEPAYRIDRLLTQLLLAGILDGAAGVAAGAFTESPDAGEGGIPPVAEILQERLAPLGVPVAFGFPFGHVPESWTLPIGVRARLDATAGTLELLEPAVEASTSDHQEG
jgi:muramoyltetrapeptide carboxypeptidase